MTSLRSGGPDLRAQRFDHGSRYAAIAGARASRYRVVMRYDEDRFCVGGAVEARDDVLYISPSR